MEEFYKEIDRFEFLELEDYCRRFQNDKFKYRIINAGYIREIRIEKEEELYIFQCYG